jgi:Na+/phosphate symporter
MWGFLSLLVALVGVLMYALSANPKLQEIGRLSFFAGLWVFLIQNGTHIVSITGH